LVGISKLTVKEAIKIIDFFINNRSEGLNQLKELTKDLKNNSNSSLASSIIRLVEQEIEFAQFLKKELHSLNTKNQFKSESRKHRK
jgi:hypothetical protein